jgi:NADP-dependent 3-hydroxy acid dehydrogenase YdfG
VLVNNAGGQFSAPAEEIGLKGWRAVQRVTLDAVWSLTHAAARRAYITGTTIVVDGGADAWGQAEPLPGPAGPPGPPECCSGR